MDPSLLSLLWWSHRREWALKEHRALRIPRMDRTTIAKCSKLTWTTTHLQLFNHRGKLLCKASYRCEKPSSTRSHLMSKAMLSQRDLQFRIQWVRKTKRRIISLFLTLQNQVMICFSGCWSNSCKRKRRKWAIICKNALPVVDHSTQKPSRNMCKCFYCLMGTSKICDKVFNQKRKQFNSQARRIVDGEQK